MDRLGGGFPHDLSDDHFDDEMDSDDFAIDPPLSPVGQDERRMQVRAYNHWAAQLGNRNFPATEDLNPDDLPDFGPFSVLLDFSGGIEDPAIRYLGSQLAQECGGVDSMARLSDVCAIRRAANILHMRYSATARIPLAGVLLVRLIWSRVRPNLAVSAKSITPMAKCGSRRHASKRAITAIRWSSR